MDKTEGTGRAVINLVKSWLRVDFVVNKQRAIMVCV